MIVKLKMGTTGTTLKEMPVPEIDEQCPNRTIYYIKNNKTCYFYTFI